MLMPSIFGESLFDDFMKDFPFYDDRDMKRMEKKLYGHHAGNLMKTDIREMDNGFELLMDLPGFTKEEVKASLKDGYLTITAAKGLDQDEQEAKTGTYIRRERFAGSCQRSFYVGEDITEADIKAEFKHGILKLFVPKKRNSRKYRRRNLSRSNRSSDKRKGTGGWEANLRFSFSTERADKAEKSKTKGRCEKW